MTIAQQLKIKEFPFEIRDLKGDLIYREDSAGFWEKWERDSNGNCFYYENSDESWMKREYDANGYQIYVEYSDGRTFGNRPKHDIQIQNAIDLLVAEGLLLDAKILKK
jgi:hypothetical protein